MSVFVYDKPTCDRFYIYTFTNAILYPMSHIQTLHLAARPGSDDNFLAIIPFETDTTMLVAPFSPAIVKYYADMLRRMPRQEQSRGSTGTDERDDDEDASDEEEITDDDDDGQLEQDEPAQGSKQERKDVDGSEKDVSSDYNSSDYERLESDDIDDDPPELSDRDAEYFASVFSQQKVLRLRMHPGQMVLLDGNTIHAGDAGKPNSWSPRLQVYAHSKKVINTTSKALACCHSSGANGYGVLTT
ncbi:hypothetical protein Vretifemale_20910 [Volvox reticuliferus]|uniref:Uncharacterized protein n=1 Tax=Volvox reticuliferus TaxID=1737510 RepID=A0A8J4D4F0_9CHLO|nr:hypothetical protein Vretifemale_20910 [Volvox reticuliferus]